MFTSQQVTINFRQYGDITVPAGTRVSHCTATGRDINYNFVDEFDWIERDYPAIATVLEQAARVYGINIPKEFITYT